MRTFEQGNWTIGAICPICGTQDSGPVVLIPVDGTEEGGIAQARQYHLECLELAETDFGRDKLLYQIYTEERDDT